MHGLGHALREWLNIMLEDYDNPYAMAQDKGWSYGLVYHVLNTGRDSSTLRQQIRATCGVSFRHVRHRLCIDCPPELIEQFDAARDGRTRAELLSDLLDLADGKGEVV